MDLKFSISTTTILFTIVAYFVYGHNISAALGMFLLIVGSALTTLLSLIPFIGVYVAFLVNTMYTYPTIIVFTGMYPTWITTLLLGFHTVIGVILTTVTSLITLSVILQIVVAKL